MSVDALRGQVPAGIEIDTYDGEGWVGVIPFWMSGVRPRWTPSLPRVSTFPELNVRTYVKSADKPGVFFFSLDAGNPLAVAVARWRFHLPYYHAAMTTGWVEKWVRYASRRVHAHAPPAEFRGRYRPTGDVALSEPGSLAAWLTERYCLYAIDRREQVHRAEIHHAPWPLQPAEAEIEVNTMAAARGFDLPDVPPLLHFAQRLDVIVWNPRRVLA
jgi:uncharacterized protein YqjF (DUF2071 family)